VVTAVVVTSSEGRIAASRRDRLCAQWERGGRRDEDDVKMFFESLKALRLEELEDST
jgi:hypothetical protein